MNSFSFQYKDYYIKPHKEHPKCYIIVTVGQGGKIPDCLNGMFTSRTLAKEDIDKYILNKPVKDNSNDKAILSGGSK